MAAASLQPSFSAVIKPSLKRNTRYSLQVRAQSFRDEGRSSNIVDANLSILRERMDEVMIKERLERSCRREHGWNYAPGYDYKLRKKEDSSRFLELVGLVFGTVGLTLFSGTAFLCLVSLLVHLNH